MTKLDDIKPLRAGIDFDLVNISLLGYDPVSAIIPLMAIVIKKSV